MTLVQTAPKKIYYGEPIIVSDMQGPSPDGFHIPLQSEWQGLNTIMTSLSLPTGNAWKINLHMPFAGKRDRSNASLSYQGSNGFYWSSSYYSGGSTTAYTLQILSDSVYPTMDYYRAYSHSVRCFKDSYVTPDSTWTVVKGTLGSAGIFWNQSEGLISITDGSTGYTIMDKNLGATTVYNNGDTLTQANMGNMYQWGNNYGFPSTGSVTTSSTQVDASTYGPGNYYSSNTFITGNLNWSRVQNNNLRGGVSQGTSEKPREIKAVYLGDTKVRPAVPATAIDYINETGIWNEGQNTNGDYDGIAFTPKVNCTLDKIIFGGSTSGTLKITQSDYASSTGTTYSISNVSEYTLSTPMQLTANTRYTISVNGIVTFSNDAINYPISGTNVTFDYITLSSGNQGYNGWGQTVNGIQTTAT